MRIEDSSFLDYPDLDGKVYGDQNATISMWADGTNIRSDVSWDRTLDLSNKRINYNLPFAEYMAPKSQVNLDKLLRDHGITRTTRQSISMADRQLAFVPEAKELEITAANSTPRFQSECNMLVRQRVVGGQSLSEYLKTKSNAKNTVKFEVHDTPDGQYEIHRYWINGDESRDDPAGHTVIVVDPQKGFSVQSFTSSVSGRTEVDFRYSYTAVDGIWVLTGVANKYYSSDSSKPVRTIIFSLGPQSLQVNQPIDAKVFSIEALRLPKGTHVNDRIENQEYLYNDIPLHLKAGLVEAKKELLQLPKDLDAPLSVPSTRNVTTGVNVTSMPAVITGGAKAPREGHEWLWWMLGLAAVVLGLVIVRAVRRTRGVK
jgi:hypothetical protein